jgi:hypothetical protein
MAIRLGEERCNNNAASILCKWRMMPALDRITGAFLGHLNTAATDVKSLEKIASKFIDFTENYKKVEGSGDPHLDAVISLRNYEMYKHFAVYLKKTGDSNPNLRAVLIGKAKESLETGRNFVESCVKTAKRNGLVNPAIKYCYKQENPTLKQALDWGFSVSKVNNSRDPQGAGYDQLRRELFVSSDDSNKYLKAAHDYYKLNDISHAAAVAMYGVSVFPNQKSDFRAILGCSTLQLGLLAEAYYHLKTASEFSGLRGDCLKKISRMVNGQ